MRASTEKKSDDSNDRLYEELAQVFDNSHIYHIKILLRNFNAKLGKEDIFKPTIGNERLHQDSDDNGVRIVNSATKKNLVLKSTMFPHRSFHIHTWASLDGKTQNQIDHKFIDRSWHSSILDVRSFRRSDCATDPYLVVAKVKGILTVK